MFYFSTIERLIERELDKEQPPKTLGPGPEWREPQRGNKGRGAKKPQVSKSVANPQEKKIIVEVSDDVWCIAESEGVSLIYLHHLSGITDRWSEGS